MTALTPNDIKEVADHFEGRPPSEVLAWAAETFAPRVALATGFGAEGCVLMHLVGVDRLPIRLFTIDTGLLFPETYKLWETLEQRYGFVIEAVRPRLTLQQQQHEWGPRLWTRDPNQCCHIRKVEPLRAFLANEDAWIAAIRRDQTPSRATARVVEWDANFGLVKINPLAGWSARDVWQFIRRERVPYNPLHDRGVPSIGCEPCTSAVAAGEDPRAGRWRGRSKDECGLHVPASPVTFYATPPADTTA